MRECLSHRNTENFRNFKREVAHSIETVDDRRSPNLQTGRFYQTRKSIDRGIYHARNLEEVGMFETFTSYVSRLVFVRLSPLGEGKDMNNPRDVANIQKKIQRGVTGYNVYRVEMGNETWEVKMEIFRNRSETLYVAKKRG